MAYFVATTDNFMTMPSSILIKTPYDEITYKIIGCAMTTHRELGPGCREDTYQRDLELRFKSSGLDCIPQKKLEVYDIEHGSELIAYYIPDFVVADIIIVEIKALHGLDNTHIAQVIDYLAVTACLLGLLINFGERSLKFKRILPPKDVTEHCLNRQWLWVPDWLRDKQPGN